MVIAFSNDNDCGILSSKLLENKEWVKQMQDLFGIIDMLESFTVTRRVIFSQNTESSNETIVEETNQKEVKKITLVLQPGM